MTTAEPSVSAGSGSPFWRFSLQLYRLPGVAQACIELQEEAGADVNLLLFLLWHGAQCRRLSIAEVERLDQEIAPWRTMTVIPLRSIRRALKAPALKAPPTLVEPGTAEAFRTKIKAVELEAERLQQEAMYALAVAAPLGAAAPSVMEAARANIAAYRAMCRTVLRASAVETLLEAVAKFHSD